MHHAPALLLTLILVGVTPLLSAATPAVPAPVATTPAPIEVAAPVPPPAEEPPLSAEEVQRKLAEVRLQLADAEAEVAAAGKEMGEVRAALFRTETNLVTAARMREGLEAEMQNRLATNATWVAYQTELADLHQQYEALQGVTKADDQWKTNYISVRNKLRNKELGKEQFRREVMEADPVLKSAAAQLAAVTRQLEEAWQNSPSYRKTSLRQTAALNRLFNARQAEAHFLALQPAGTVDGAVSAPESAPSP